MNKNFALQLRQDRNFSKRSRQVSFDIELKDTFDKAKFYKAHLEKALEDKDSLQAERYVNELVRVRAEQTAITLDKMKSEGKTVTQDIIDAYTAQYYEDCDNFFSALDHIT